MTNNKLKGRIVEKYGSIGAFTKEANINRSTMSLLLNGKTKWREDKMLTVIKMLCIPNEEVVSYFFPGSLEG